MNFYEKLRNFIFKISYYDIVIYQGFHYLFKHMIYLLNLHSHSRSARVVMVIYFIAFVLEFLHSNKLLVPRLSFQNYYQQFPCFIMIHNSLMFQLFIVILSCDFKKILFYKINWMYFFGYFIVIVRSSIISLIKKIVIPIIYYHES